MIRKILHWFGVHSWEYFEIKDEDHRSAQLAKKCTVCGVIYVYGVKL